jgi:tetratricopeptide (TPR) repeat protein
MGGVHRGADAQFLGSVRMVRVPKCVEAVRPAVATRAFLLAQLARRFCRLAAGIKSVAIGVLCLLLAIAPACAQIAAWSGRSGLDALYQTVLRDPKNIRLTLQYAQLAKDQGDYEAAIAAYERLLLFNPALPDVQYELGVLYFSLESYATAKSYFEKVIASPYISGSLRDNAAAYLKEIDRRLSPTRFSGYFHSGLRYQTNANFGSSAGIGQFGGQDVALLPSLVKKPDWSAFVFNDLFFSQDFGNRGDRFEVSLSDYYAKQFRINQVDLGIAELQFGPRLMFFPETFSNTTTRIYGIVNGALLGDAAYFATSGSGLSFDSKLNPVTTISTSVEYRDRTFYNSTNYPTAGQLTGDLITASFAASGLVYGPVSWFARLSYDWNSSYFNFWSYRRPNIELGMPVSFDVNVFGSARSGRVTPYVGGAVMTFETPDPDYNPAVTRGDRTWYVGATVETTLVGQAALRLNVNYLNNDSNIINFTYRDLSISFGPAISF